MVKLYKLSGDAAVFPGLSAPFSNDIVRAINHALMISNFYENILKPDHMPPEYIWPFDDEITKWFDAIKAENGQGSTGDDEENSIVVENEHAERFK